MSTAMQRHAHADDIAAALAETLADERISIVMIVLNAMATLVVLLGALHWLLGALWP